MWSTTATARCGSGRPDYGDDKDRVLVKSDGEYTYLLPDIAYHRDKFSRGWDRLINILGADHHGYVARLRAAVTALGHAPEELECELTQLVRLMRDGDEVRLSKRTGDMIELRDLVEEIGPDATRFTYLLQSVDTPQSIDLDVVVSQSMENPVFYVQMAHARLCTLEAVAAERGVSRGDLNGVDLSVLGGRARTRRAPGALHPPRRGRVGRSRAGSTQDLQLGPRSRRRRARLLPRLSGASRRRPRRTPASTSLRGRSRQNRPGGRSGAVGRERTRVDVMTTLPQSLLPDTAEVAPDGRLLIGGVDTLELAEEYGTPLFVYDEAHLRERCREAVAAFGDGVAYATKAFLCKAMARLAHEEGMLLDVATGGELHVALAAGVPGSRCVLHGNNKSTEELRLALDNDVGRIVVDSFDELDRLAALHAETGRVPTVLIRVTPGVDAHTHEFVKTGQEDSKFGFGWHSGAAKAAVEWAQRSPAVELVGLHMHIGSQVFVAENFARSVETVAPLVREFGLPEFCVGGGLGVAYVEGERAPTITEWADSIRGVCDATGIDAHVTAEPGRSIAAQAAVTLYTVGTIKEIPDVRTYVAVDGGMSDNPRPVLYSSGYETFLPRSVARDRPKEVRLVGKHCESGDLLVRSARVPADIAVGDVIATPVTGAYGHSMGSNYNKVRRPAVVFVDNGDTRVVVRRETYEDLTRLDIG